MWSNVLKIYYFVTVIQLISASFHSIFFCLPIFLSFLLYCGRLLKLTGFNNWSFIQLNNEYQKSIYINMMAKQQLLHAKQRKENSRIFLSYFLSLYQAKMKEMGWFLLYRSKSLLFIFQILRGFSLLHKNFLTYETVLLYHWRICSVESWSTQ